MNGLWVCQKYYKTETKEYFVHLVSENHLLWTNLQEIFDVLEWDMAEMEEQFALYEKKTWHDLFFKYQHYAFSYDRTLQSPSLPTSWPLDTKFISEAGVRKILNVKKNMLRSQQQAEVLNAIPPGSIISPSPEGMLRSLGLKWLSSIYFDLRDLINVKKQIDICQKSFVIQTCNIQNFIEIESSHTPIQEENNNSLLIFQDLLNKDKFKFVFAKSAESGHHCQLHNKKYLTHNHFTGLPNTFCVFYIVFKTRLMQLRKKFRSCDFEQIIELKESVDPIIIEVLEILHIIKSNRDNPIEE
ncbi:hypothetical protein DLEV_131 [Diachasmimorpha longicaudata entomopoxvirus]|uniref:Uncharacterized protein n=1 Tax=Diachasmimorpha longicaudata entomopoxvirus TaxID=109981 RepID=A0A7R5WD65_9POXV|nr:hypothetical protein QKK69_gp131 [Diachasmimorpha longicaudata entomopoxvirus]AKS26422.1 hypothetical protein DLEV_131 [Diachasmimorpha longicaudata entomopoxvirus]